MRSKVSWIWRTNWRDGRWRIIGASSKRARNAFWKSRLWIKKTSKLYGRNSALLRIQLFINRLEEHLYARHARIVRFGDLHELVPGRLRTLPIVALELHDALEEQGLGQLRVGLQGQVELLQGFVLFLHGEIDHAHVGQRLGGLGIDEQGLMRELEDALEVLELEGDVAHALEGGDVLGILVETVFEFRNFLFIHLADTGHRSASRHRRGFAFSGHGRRGTGVPPRLARHRLAMFARLDATDERHADAADESRDEKDQGGPREELGLGRVALGLFLTVKDGGKNRRHEQGEDTDESDAGSGERHDYVLCFFKRTAIPMPPPTRTKPGKIQIARFKPSGLGSSSTHSP